MNPGRVTPVRGSRRLGWRGVAVEVHATDDVLAALDAHVPEFYVAGGEVVAAAQARVVDGLLVVELPEQLSLTGPFDEHTLRAVSSRLELLVCTHLPDRIAVHAGAVAVGGRAIVLPGSSMAGKSTLVAALLELGATYFSDEFALLDEQGLVWPYPRPMTMRGSGGRQRAVPAGSAAPQGPPVPVGVLAELRYAPAGWDVAGLSAAQAVLALLGNTPAVRRDSDRALSALSAALAHCPPALQGTRGEAAEAAPQVLAALR